MEAIMDRADRGKTVKPTAARALQRRRTAGVVMVEYAFLLVFFGVPVMIGTAAAGIHLIQAYGDIRNDMLGKGP
jgi:hypothetical protein